MEAANPSSEQSSVLTNANYSITGVNFDDVQPIDYSALFRCVAHLFKDGQTSRVMGDMVEASRLNTSAPASAATDCLVAPAPATDLAANQTSDSARPQMASLQQTTTTTTTSNSSSPQQCLSFRSLSTELANHLFEHQVQQDYLGQQQQQQPAPQAAGQVAQLSASSPSTTTTLAGAGSSASGQPDLFGVLDRLDNFSQLNWTQLGHKLPAFESSIKLEILEADWQLYLTIIYTLTAVTSFVLNVVTVIVLTRSRRSELRKYLINLSVSDLLMSLFSIPFTYTEYMFGRWIFPNVLCPVVRFVVTLSVFVSVATMTVIGINRHLAIMYPLKRKKYSKFKRWSIRQSHVILLIWMMGIAFSLPEYFMFRAEPFCYNHQLAYDCRHSNEDNLSNSYTVFIYMSTFAIPLTLLSYLYTSIGLKLWHRQMPGNVDVNRDLTMQNKRAKVVKMLFVVVLLFAVFWLPLQTFSLVLFLFPGLRKGFVYRSIQYNIFIATYFACHWLSMAHSCLNPLIYCFMNEKFRSELHALICRTRRDRQHQLVDTYSAPATAATPASAARSHHYSFRNNYRPQQHHHHHQQQQQQKQQQQYQHQPLARYQTMATTTTSISTRLERTSSNLDQDYYSGAPPNGGEQMQPADELAAAPTGGAQQQLNGQHKVLRLVNNLANNTITMNDIHRCNYHQANVDGIGQLHEEVAPSSASLVECTLLKLAASKGNGCHGQTIKRATSQVETLSGEQEEDNHHHHHHHDEEEEVEEEEEDDDHYLQKRHVDMVVVVASLGHNSMGTDRQIL